MHEDLQELAAEKERKRKEWKQKGLSAEKRVQDADTAMEKAKVKYNSLAEDYDRARTGDKQPGRFGLKGPKSAAQVEEDLHRKMQAADSDYSGKVQTTHALRQELINTLRPQAVQAIEQLINECDSGITLQMQKYGNCAYPFSPMGLTVLATFNEKLLLSNGLCISPIKAPEASQRSQTRSLRDVIREIDNEMDLRSYVSDFASRVGPRHADSRYESYPVGLIVSSLAKAVLALAEPSRRRIRKLQLSPPYNIPVNCKGHHILRATTSNEINSPQLSGHPRPKPKNPQIFLLSLRSPQTAYKLPLQRHILPSPLHTKILTSSP